jgi:hypothetical protein
MHRSNRGPRYARDNANKGNSVKTGNKRKMKRSRNEPEYTDNYAESQPDMDSQIYNAHLNTGPPPYDPAL